jgi:malonyl-CoA/methylmalonyl-CoA synthetase
MTEPRRAIIAAEGEFTYDHLDTASRRVAAALLDGRTDLEQERVAFLVPPSFAHAAVQRGIWRAGGVAVPLATRVRRSWWARRRAAARWPRR